MSAIEALAPADRSRSGVTARPEGRERPRLVLLTPGTSRVSRFPFILGLVALLALGMAGLVVVNTQIQTQATQLAELDQQATNLEYQQAKAQAEVNQLRSSSNLEVQAYRLGLRPNPRPAFIVLPDGKLLGTPTPVTGRELPDQVYLTWEQAVQQLDAARAAVAQQKAEQARRAEQKRQAEEAAARKRAEDKKKADAEEARKKAEQASARPASSAAPSQQRTGGR